MQGHTGMGLMEKKKTLKEWVAEAQPMIMDSVFIILR